VAAAIQELKEEPVPPKPQSASGEAAKSTTAKSDTDAQPSRHWVQVAGTAEKDELGSEFARLRAKAPKLLAGRSAWTAPLRFTNRLLVGPFKSDAEAQDFVNELAKADLTAFTWTSPAGQEIVKLASR
jgi:cell division protein FtsN